MANSLILEVAVKYIHFLSLFFIISSIAAEYILFKPEMTRKEIGRMARIDGIYGMNALLLLAAGLTLWFGVGKPAEFYSKNWIFMTKLTLFAIVGLISIYPTRFFLKQRKGDPNEKVVMPPKLKTMIRLELLILFLIPLLATLMSKGVGFST
jgi:putative membrane protein